jgi:HAD superfamily hydrolase (TIGR01549 family)
MLEGVLFDLEDTLVIRKSYQADVDQVTFEVIAQVRRCGVTEAQQLFQKARRSFPTTLATIKALGVPKEELHARLDQIELSNQVLVTKSVPGMVHQLAAKGLKLGLVTNMPRGLTLKVLRSAGIPLGLFTAIVTGSDVLWPKPALEPFCLAIRLMALRSYRCLMIGDREEVDIDPAKRLGMVTVLIGDTALRADYMLASLVDLESLIARQYTVLWL